MHVRVGKTMDSISILTFPLDLKKHCSHITKISIAN
jgi:hypothetical protein